MSRRRSLLFGGLLALAGVFLVLAPLGLTSPPSAST